MQSIRNSCELTERKQTHKWSRVALEDHPDIAFAPCYALPVKKLQQRDGVFARYAGPILEFRHCELLPFPFRQQQPEGLESFAMKYQFIADLDRKSTRL